MRILSNYVLRFIQDPAGIFDLVEVVGNGTYGQVHKVTSEHLLQFLVFIFACKRIVSLHSSLDGSSHTCFGFSTASLL